MDIEIRMAEAKIDQPHTAMTLRGFTSDLLGQDSIHQGKTNDPDCGLPPRGGWLMSDNSDQVRVRAYELWELAAEPSGDNDRFWREAVAEFESRRVRQELEK